VTKVSIIIPAYNQAAFLPEAIDSALGQTHAAVEVIVVDDGSPDDTASVCRRYGSRIHYIHKENAGLSAARNTGILAAAGDFVIFLDSDDFLPLETVQKHLQTIEARPDIDVAYATYLYVDMSGSPTLTGFDPFVEDDAFHQLLLGNLFPSHAAMTRRSSLANSGLFDVDLKSVEDWDLWLRLAARGSKFVRTADIAVPYRQYPDSMSKDYDRMRRAALMVLTKARGYHVGCAKCRRNIANARWNIRRAFLKQVIERPGKTGAMADVAGQISRAVIHDPPLAVVRVRDAMRWVKWRAVGMLDSSGRR